MIIGEIELRFWIESLREEIFWCREVGVAGESSNEKDNPRGILHKK